MYFTKFATIEWWVGKMCIENKSIFIWKIIGNTFFSSSSNKNRRQIYQTTTEYTIMSQCIFPVNGLFQHSAYRKSLLLFTDYPLGSFMLWQKQFIHHSIFCLINKPSMHNRKNTQRLQAMFMAGKKLLHFL